MRRVVHYTALCAAAAMTVTLGCQSSNTTQDVTIPSGTTITVALEDPLRTNNNEEGDEFIARTTEAIVISGTMALPAGAPIRGQLTEVRKPEENGGRPTMTLEFAEVVDGSGDLKKIAVEPVALVGGEERGDNVFEEVIDAIKGKNTIGDDGGIAEDSVVVVATENYQLDLSKGQAFEIQLMENLEVAVLLPEEPKR